MNWGVAGNVMVAWIITIPASAAVAAIFYWVATDITRGLIALEAAALVGLSVVAWRELKQQPDREGRIGALLAWGAFITVAIGLIYALTA